MDTRRHPINRLAGSVARLTDSPKRLTVVLALGVLLLILVAMGPVLIGFVRQQLIVIQHPWVIVPRSAVPFSSPPMQNGVLGAPIEKTSLLTQTGGHVEVGGAIVDGGLSGAAVLVVWLPWDGQRTTWRYPAEDESVYVQLCVPTRAPGGVVLTMPGSANVTMVMSEHQYRAWVESDPGLQSLAQQMLTQATGNGWIPDLRTVGDPPIWLPVPALPSADR